jgi:hypothetical protein
MDSQDWLLLLIIVVLILVLFSGTSNHNTEHFDFDGTNHRAWRPSNTFPDQKWPQCEPTVYLNSEARMDDYVNAENYIDNYINAPAYRRDQKALDAVTREDCRIPTIIDSDCINRKLLETNCMSCSIKACRSPVMYSKECLKKGKGNVIGVNTDKYPL